MCMYVYTYVSISIHMPRSISISIFVSIHVHIHMYNHCLPSPLLERSSHQRVTEVLKHVTLSHPTPGQTIVSKETYHNSTRDLPR